LVPLKLLVLVWRLYCKTKYHQKKRGILAESLKSCSFGCGKDENVSHLFSECTIVLEVWQQILRWLHISFVLHDTSLVNFHQFSGLIANGKVIIEQFSSRDYYIYFYNVIKLIVIKFTKLFV
jgi:hypothetical protein